MSLSNEILPPRRAAVYRLRNAEGALLYVGSSYDPESRCVEVHRHTAWWPNVARRENSWFPSRAEAYAAESAAIKAESPRFNSVGTSSHVEKCRAGYLAHCEKVRRRRKERIASRVTNPRTQKKPAKPEE